MELTPQTTALLVQRALVLEPLADKQDCTTRFVDLPNRPLENFVLAGINVGPVFEEFGRDWLAGGETRLFHRFVDALEVSNEHGSGKFVNFGLLEILFPAVAARIVCREPEQMVPTIIDLMEQAPASDVAEMVRARELAWSTSEKRDAKLKDLTPAVRAAEHPYDFYERVVQGDPHGSTAEWVDNYKQGLPLLGEQFEALRTHPPASMLDKIQAAYDAVRAKNPGVRTGILADMSAAAIFLYLSL
ncbi:MAG TPA: hypothetical protein VLF91_02265 [Candidatus Saccharimonadales bacterium]|nr:hypothetical protein [Candidatus Saccharimonadales bacterium]